MAQLLVRGLEDTIVEALKERAREHNVSAEEEHRRIPEEALKRPKKKSFEEFKYSLPKSVFLNEIPIIKPEFNYKVQLNSLRKSVVTTGGSVSVRQLTNTPGAQSATRDVVAMYFPFPPN